MGRKLSILICFEDLQTEQLIKNGVILRMAILPFNLPIDKIIMIEGTFSVMRITLSKMKRSRCPIDMAEARHP